MTLDSSLFSASPILHIYNSKYRFPFQTAEDCWGKEEVLVHLKSHLWRNPPKLLSGVNGSGITITVLLEIAAIFLLLSGPLCLPNMVKVMLPFQARGENQHMAMTLAYRKLCLCGSLVTFPDGLSQMLEETVTPLLWNLWLPIRKKEVLGLVNSTYLVSSSFLL